MMRRQLVVTSFQIFNHEIAGVVARSLPLEVLFQGMNGYQSARNHSAGSILYRTANASEGGLASGSGEKNQASQQPCYGQIHSKHVIPPASRAGLLPRFVGLTTFGSNLPEHTSA